MTDHMDLDAIEARAKAATPGKWELREDSDYYQGGTYLGVGPMHWRREPGDTHPKPRPGPAPDGPDRTYFQTDIARLCEDAPTDFLLHCRDDVLALIAEVRRLRALATCDQCDAEHVTARCAVHCGFEPE